MISNKSLTAADEVNGPFVVPRDSFTQAGIQYGAGGLGTIVLEGTRNDTDWVTIGFDKDDGSGVATSLAAAGGGHADISTLSQIRIRKSVAGAGAVLTSLSISASV